jgi:CRP-like cAMP-binding protein
MKNYLKLATSLHEVPFFRSLSPSAFSRVEDLVYHREYEPRQIIFFPDDLCDHIYWVREGRVKVTLVSQDRRELTLRHLFPGDIFGEECLVEKGRRGLYAEAMTHTILCMMRADDIRRVARENSEVSYQLSQRLCARLIESERVLAQTVFQSVRSRVASGLLRLHRRIPKEGPLAITHQELANLVGSTRETTTVVLHELREEGILTIGNRRIRIIDPVALEQAARSD